MTIKDEICPTVIKVDARLLGDGTLWIKTDKDSLEKVNRVIVEDGKTRCKQFYQDAPEQREDAVSREAVLDALRTCYDTETITYDNGDEYIHYGDAVGEVEQLPPVTPKQRTGKWTDGDSICPVCGEDKFKDLDADIWADWKPKFCPNCGAKMEGDAE